MVKGDERQCQPHTAAGGMPSLQGVLLAVSGIAEGRGLDCRVAVRMELGRTEIRAVREPPGYAAGLAGFWCSERCAAPGIGERGQAGR